MQRKLLQCRSPDGPADRSSLKKRYVEKSPAKPPAIVSRAIPPKERVKMQRERLRTFIPKPFRLPTRQVRGGSYRYVISDDLRREVEIMVAGGLSAQAIADLFGMDVTTFQHNFAEEVKNGATLIAYGVTRELLARGFAGDTTSLIYFSKARMHWFEAKPDEAEVRLEAGERFAVAVRAAPEALAQLVKNSPQLLQALPQHGRPAPLKKRQAAVIEG